MRAVYPLAGIAIALVVVLSLMLYVRSAGPDTYEVRGRIVGFGADRTTVFVRHGPVQGLMPEMTMPFRVADSAEVAALQYDDSVAFLLDVGPDVSLARGFQVVERGTRTAPRGPASTGAQVGDRMPEVQLRDQDGRLFRPQDLAVPWLLTTFIYTRCPLPDYCPLMSLQFSRVQGTAAKELGRSLHLLSITFDPGYDSPEVLRSYAARYTRDFSNWTFATGDSAAVATLTRFFGVTAERDGAMFDHNLVTALIDAEGRVVRIWPGNGWRPADVIQALSDLSAPSDATHAATGPARRDDPSQK